MSVILIITVGCASYTCPDDYELEGRNCIRTHEKEASYEGGCDSGYELVDYRCIKETVYDATTRNSCSDGYTMDESECVYHSTVTTERTTRCPAGYNFVNVSEVEEVIDPTRRWCQGWLPGCTGGAICRELILATVICGNCPYGYTQDSRSCLCTRYSRIPMYSCNEGDKLYGTRCINQRIKESSMRYVCGSGYELNTQNNNCTRREEIAATRN